MESPVKLIEEMCKQFGFRPALVRTGKHLVYELTGPKNKVVTYTVAKTPSSYRTLENTRADLKRLMKDDSTSFRESDEERELRMEMRRGRRHG